MAQSLTPVIALNGAFNRSRKNVDEDVEEGGHQGGRVSSTAPSAVESATVAVSSLIPRVSGKEVCDEDVCNDDVCDGQRTDTILKHSA